MSIAQEHYTFDPLAEVRASMGLVVNFSKGTSPKHGQEPPHQYEILRDIYFNDPIISSAVDLKAEVVLSNGWRFRGKNQREIERADKEFDRVNMYEVLLNFLKQAEVYGDAYLEPRFLGVNDKLNEVWPLDTVITRIKYDKNGVVKGYLQVQHTTLASDPAVVEWAEDEILHFKANWVGSEVYSLAPFASISHQLASRFNGNHYINQIFKNLPPKMVHILKGTSVTQRDQYQQTLLGLKSNMMQDMVVNNPNPQGDIDIKQLIVDFTKGGIIDVLHYVREEILTRMRVPPALLGLEDSSGRSEPQLFIFETHMRTIQRRVAKFLNNKLLPLMGLGNVELYFPPVSMTGEDSSMSVARSMIDAGITGPGSQHPALIYLREKGFDIPETSKVEDPKEKDIDSMQSRKRKGRDQGKEEVDNRNQQGDSVESRDKIAKSQTRAVQTGDFQAYMKNRKV